MSRREESAVEIVILGAGVAGLSLAGAFTDRGVAVTVVDPELENEESALPVGMVNPAMGRRAKPGWQGEACWRALRMRVEGLARWRGVDLPIQDGGILRPAITEERAELYQKSIESYNWPPDQLRWLTSDELQRTHPYLPASKGALLVVDGYAIHVRTYQKLYREWLASSGVNFRAQSGRYDWTPESDEVAIHLSDGSSLRCRRLIVASGAATRELPGWSFAPLHNVKGEMVSYRSTEPIPWSGTLSGRGFAVRRGDRELIAGSNYDHHPEHSDPTEEAREEIESKLNDLLPDLTPELTRTDQWAGFRVTTPNRRPVAGLHPEWPSLGIFSGLNSSGLLYSERIAGLLTDHVMEGSPMPKEILPDRFL